MNSPFRKGRRVCVANDMALLYGHVTEPRFDLGNGYWGVWIMLPLQERFEEFLRDISQYQGAVDVTYGCGVFKGSAVSAMSREPDGSSEIFVVPAY